MDRFSTAVLFAEGATSQVYRAHDPATGGEVALKLLRSDDPELLRRFLLEIKALRRLDHPCIARFVDHGEIEGRPYLAMAFADGIPFDRALAGQPPEVVVRAFLKVADALAHAHDQGLLHRDLKPANIPVHQIDGVFEPMLVDFGLARDVAAASETASGALLGTPAYMAPEQARGDGDAIDRRTDVYGLGAVLYAALTGSAPRSGDSAGDIIASILSEPPPRPGPDVPLALEAILNRAMACRPEDRYASVRRLAADLEAWLNGQSVRALRGFRWRQARQAVMRRKWLAAGTAAALVVLVALGAQQAWLHQRATEQRRLAVQFSEELAETREWMRLRYLAPAHDIRSGWDFVEDRIEALRIKARSEDTRNLSAVHYALGRLLLDAGRPDEALAPLQQARSLGCASADCASALARAHLLLHRRELEHRMASIGSDRDDAFGHHLVAAQEALAGVEVVGPAAVAVASATQPLERVAAMGEAAMSALPWAFEVPQAIGDARFRAGLNAMLSDDYAEAWEHFRASVDDYERAAEIARSYPEAYLGICRALVRMAGIAGMDQEHRRDISPDAIHRCAEARGIDSARVAAYTLPAIFEEIAADSAYNRGDFADASQRIENARATLDEAPAEARDTVAFAHAEANVLATSTVAQQLVGPPAVARLQAALSAAQRAIDLDADNIFARRAWISILSLLTSRDAESAAPYATRAVEFARTIARRWPEDRVARRALGNTLQDLAYHRRLAGNIDEKTLREAISILEALLAEAPGFMQAQHSLGIAWWELAVTQLEQDAAFREAESRSRRLFEDLLAREPDRPSTLINLSSLNLSVADILIERGQDPGDRLLRSLALLERVQSLGEYLPCDFALAFWLRFRVASDPVAARSDQEKAAEHARAGSGSDCSRVAEALNLQLASGSVAPGAL
ncbi:MAG: serine/threonine-protein kinase [Wenzhouxiangellaceae bacterium]